MKQSSFSASSSVTVLSVPLGIVMAIMFWRALLASSLFGMAVWGILFVGLLAVVIMDCLTLSRPQMPPARRVALSVIFGLVPACLFFGLYHFVAGVLHAGSVPRFLSAAISACTYTFVWCMVALVCRLKEMNPAGRLFSCGLALLLSLLLVVPCFLRPAVFFAGYTEKNVSRAPAAGETWSEGQPFNLSDDTVTLQKDPERDLVILNLADIQLTDMDLNPLTPLYRETFATIEALIRLTQPDLITITGDTGCGYARATEAIVAFVDHFGIPWAPVFGNHDHEVYSCTPEYTAKLYREAENCLFRDGPAELGIGNYVITVMEGETPVHALIMMDSHDHFDYKTDGKTVRDYAQITPRQTEWYRWVVDGLASASGGVVPSTVFAHIPVIQFEEAFNACWDYDACPKPSRCEDVEAGCYLVEGAFGVLKESVNAAKQDFGFFDAMLEQGSTTRYVCGHDHSNCATIPWQGIDLSYGMHTGPGCYGAPELYGGLVITLSSDGRTSAYLQTVSLR